MKSKEKKGRKAVRILILVLSILLMIACGTFILMYAMDVGYKVEFYQISSDKVSENRRIVFISDLHLKEYGEGNSELISTIRNLDPDVILVGGDLVIYGNSNYDNMLDLCGKLSEIAPLYGVLGNHESQMIYKSGDSELVSRFEASGLVFLRNSETTIKVGSDSISLVGISGTSAGFERDGGKAFMDSLEATDALRICIAHIPTLFKGALGKYSYDLALSGHTHGGIVIIPGIGGLYTEEEGFRPDMDYGEKTLGNGASLIISRGLGDSSTPSFRINNYHELSVIDITWY